LHGRLYHGREHAQHDHLRVRLRDTRLQSQGADFDGCAGGIERDF
jgi:hypothetical protein